jgi:hypothetical protein
MANAPKFSDLVVPVAADFARVQVCDRCEQSHLEEESAQGGLRLRSVVGMHFSIAEVGG